MNITELQALELLLNVEHNIEFHMHGTALIQLGGIINLEPICPFGWFQKGLCWWSFQPWTVFWCWKRDFELVNSTEQASAVHFNLANPCTDLMWSARPALLMNFLPQPEISHPAGLMPLWTYLMWLKRYAWLTLFPHSAHSTIDWWEVWWFLSSLYTANSESQSLTLHFSFG